MVCGTRLRWRDLIPIFSYLLLKGRCGHCGVKYSARYFWNELLVAALGVTILWVGWDASQPVLSLQECAPHLIFMLVLDVVMWIDYDHRLILNKVLLTGGALLLVAVMCSHIGQQNIFFVGLRSLGDGLLLCGSFFAISLLLPSKVIGMGDIKLMTLFGMTFGYQWGLIGAVVSMTISGAVAMLLLVLKKVSWKSSLPMGPGFMAGAVILSIYLLS